MTSDELWRWLFAFADCVRSQNYARARQLFDRRVRGFGTQVREANGIEELEALQWRVTWPHTSDFYFGSTDMQWPVVTAMWQSQGPNGTRLGRATLIFHEDCGKCLCIHSHFSLNPVPEFG